MDKRSLLVAGVVALLVGMQAAAVAEDKPRDIAIGVVTNAPPMSILEDGEYTGLSNDILRRVAETENLKLNYQPMKFPALIPALQAGQIEMAVSGIFVTEERKKVVDFSDPYYTQGAVLVAPEDSKITDVAGLKGKTIAAEQGSAALGVANKHAAEWGVTVRVLQDPSKILLAMKTGDVDAMIYDSGLVAYQLRSRGNKAKIKVVGDVIDPTGIAFAFPKGSNLTAVINAGIAKMKDNAELAKIKQKYQLD
ncbi:transporter substrate-binding domain-containing protein [Bradyrhizobium sp. 191]|uniref:substrate-binding periplasmic protein n=1 Tax=Bradyrhizobium sp. 191 TaxID=2782659 RepID=UPI001FFE83B5|nr:transporter substrate-binding domain-containing protein [Bradyrhizobium sp. 191]UPJ63688.1 amino acid ABC transporter substrate-binding protein [Bradyrhizobium sp. 191]